MDNQINIDNRYLALMNILRECSGLVSTYGTPQHTEIMIKRCKTYVIYMNCTRSPTKLIMTINGQHEVVNDDDLVDWIDDKLRATGSRRQCTG